MFATVGLVQDREVTLPDTAGRVAPTSAGPAGPDAVRAPVERTRPRWTRPGIILLLTKVDTAVITNERPRFRAMPSGRNFIAGPVTMTANTSRRRCCPRQYRFVATGLRPARCPQPFSDPERRRDGFWRRGPA